MPQVYDNWERLVRATLRREWLREIAHRTPSDLSLASSASFNFGVSSRREISSIILPTDWKAREFEFDHILRASNYFNESNLIARGHSGDLFFGVLDNEIPVVVKKSLDQKDAYYYLRELKFYCDAKDTRSRLVPLLGYCLDDLNNRLFLVYHYMPHLDLASSLFREPNPDDLNKYSLRSLDWIKRLKIATGVAEALSYLHHECSPPLVHRDIRASSILLDDKYEVWLGSFSSGRAQEGEKQKEQNQNRFSKFLRLPRPPKTIKSTPGIPNATCTYDVYCFGKVLLELVTGKLGISDASGEDRLQQLLPYITIRDQELVLQIVDPSLVIDKDLLKEVWSMAVVARACLNPNPSKRPLMKSVLKALESPLEVVREDFLGNRLVETSPISPRNAIMLGSLWGSPSDLAANPRAQPPSGLVAKKVPPPALKRKDFPATRLVSSVETLPIGGVIYRFAPSD